LFRHLYVRECLQFNMEKKPSRADLISMLYSKNGGEKRKILHEEVLAAWELKEFGHHLHLNLQHMLNYHPNDMGAFFIWMTIRCRRADFLEEKALILVKRGMPALKQFLTHLDRLVHDPFLRSAASEAVVVNDKFSSKSNYFAMFQLERVRLLRAGVKMDNNNLEQAVKILHAIKPRDDGDEYGGIYVPSSAMEATKWLQLALCSARTANHQRTIEYARKIISELDKKHARSFSNVKRVFEWWAMKIEERVVSSYSGINLQKEGRKKMIAFEKNTPDKDTKQYLNDMKKKNEGNRGMEGYKTWYESNDVREDLNNTILYDFMYVKHSILSAFINSPSINPKRKFDKMAVEKVMKGSKNQDIYTFFKKNQPNTRKRRKNANNLLSNIVTGRTRERNGLARIGLLLDHTIFTSKKKWVKYLLGSASSSILHAHAAVERDMRMQPAVLAMIGIDVCAQISHLGSFALSRKKKGWYITDPPEGEGKWKCIDDGETELLTSRLIEAFEIICRGIKNSIGKDCSEVNIYQWAQSTLETLKVIRDEVDSKLKFTKIIQLCQRSIGWADYIEVEKFKNKLKNYMNDEFEEWSVEKSELFIEVFFNDIDDVANNLHCDVAQLQQSLIHLSRDDGFQNLLKEKKYCECRKKVSPKPVAVKPQGFVRCTKCDKKISVKSLVANPDKRKSVDWLVANPFCKKCRDERWTPLKPNKVSSKRDNESSQNRSVFKHDVACMHSNSGMEMLFEKLGITNAVDCRELGPIYLSRVSLVKEEGWKIKTTLCDDVFLARNTTATSEDGLPLTRYQGSPAEYHQ
jgi:hypothetical protein